MQKNQKNELKSPETQILSLWGGRWQANPKTPIEADSLPSQGKAVAPHKDIPMRRTRHPQPPPPRPRPLLSRKAPPVTPPIERPLLRSGGASVRLSQAAPQHRLAALFPRNPAGSTEGKVVPWISQISAPTVPRAHTKGRQLPSTGRVRRFGYSHEPSLTPENNGDAVRRHPRPNGTSPHPHPQALRTLLRAEWGDGEDWLVPMPVTGTVPLCLPTLLRRETW